MVGDQPVNTRELISDLDINLLYDGYTDPYDQTQSTYTLNYPTPLGNTFQFSYDPTSRLLTLNPDTRVANNDFKLTLSGSSLDADLNGVVKSYPLASLSGVNLITFTGHDTVTLPGDPLRFPIDVFSNGPTKVVVANSSANVLDTLENGADSSSTSLLINRLVPVRGILVPSPLFSGRITFQRMINLTVIGHTADRATVLGTSSSTTTNLFAIGSVTVGPSEEGTRTIAGPVAVAGDGVGSINLTIDDSADRSQVDATITASSITGLAAAPIYYDGSDLRSFTIKGARAPSIYNVSNTPQNGRQDLAMTLDTGPTGDVVVVTGASSDLTLDEGAGRNSLYVDMAQLYGTLTTHSTGGLLSITADDSNDTTSRSVELGSVLVPVGAAGKRKGVVSQLERIGFIQGLGNGQIFYDPAAMDYLNVITGDPNPAGPSPQGNTVTVLSTIPGNALSPGTSIKMLGHDDVTNVESTAGPLTVSGETGLGDTVNVGVPQSGRLDAIHGLLTVSQAALNIVDTADPSRAPVTYAIEPAGLEVNATAAIAYSSLTQLSLAGPNGNSVYDIQAVPGNNLTVRAGSGNDTFNVSSPSGSLDGLTGNVLLEANGGRDGLTINDSAASGSVAYSLDTKTVANVPSTIFGRQDSLVIAARGFAGVAIKGGNHGDTFAISSALPSTALALHGGAGNDKFTMGAVAPNAPISIDGGGGTNTLDYSSYSGQRTTTGLPAGIVSWYKAEGNASDAVGNNNGTTTNVTYGPGEVGQAFQFSGKSSYVSIPDSPTLDPATVTVEAWVKGTNVAPFEVVMAKGADANWGGSYGLYTGDSGGLFFEFLFQANPNGAGFVSPGAGPGIWDGQWHHVAGTYDGASVRLYVDGKQVGSGTPAQGSIAYNLPTSNVLSIGTYLGPYPSQFTGAVDELAIYDRALSASEIQAIYNLGTAGKTGAPSSSTNGVEVNLQLGTATGLARGVSHIQNLVGSPGNDILVGNGGNFIKGLGGQDLLIAGPSGSILEGTGADILIGGQTLDAGNMAALDAVLNEWSDPTATFADRVAALRSGPLAAGRVKSNKQHNVLLGGSGPNLFFTSGIIDATNQSNSDASFTL